MCTAPAGPDGGSIHEWVPDTILDGYERLSLSLPGASIVTGEPGFAPSDGKPDPALRPTATLVRRVRCGNDSRRALLYVHGWSDYFFQAHLADVMTDLGFDFHAIDLRRYGRSLREGQLPGFITDLDDYAEELDAALAVLRQDHDSVTVMGHSTGGLATALWVDRRPGQIDGLILNSPWLDLQASNLMRAVTAPVVQRLRRGYPTAVLKLADNGFYGRTISAEQEGEWTLEPELKGGRNFVVRVGWLAAILAGHDRVAGGLAIDVPVLILTSSRSDFRRSWDEALKSADTVLDVQKIAARAVNLGSHVTVVKIEDGLHDLALSAPAVRERYFDEIRRWVRAYLE